MTVKFYKTKEPYGFLNNFYRAKFFIYGRWWDTVEHAYQAQKTTIHVEYDAIHAAASPRLARDLGQQVNIDPNWDIVKSQVMFECVLAKFVQHHDLRTRLLETDDEEIIEDSPIDYFWGCGANGTGRNELGKILMTVRGMLKE